MTGRNVFNGEYVRVEAFSSHGIDHADIFICNPGFGKEGPNVIGTPVLKEYLSALDAVRKSRTEYVLAKWDGETTGYGASITEFGEMLQSDDFRHQLTDFLQRGIEAALKVHDLPCYTIAIVHGKKGIHGGSGELPLAYKWIIGSDDTFLVFSEAGLGIVPGYGGLALAYVRAGKDNTEQFISRAGAINAGTAARIGMIDQTTGDPLDAAHRLIRSGEKPEREPVEYELAEKDIDLSKRRAEPPQFVVERIPVIMDEIERVRSEEHTS